MKEFFLIFTIIKILFNYLNIYKILMKIIFVSYYAISFFLFLLEYTFQLFSYFLPFADYPENYVLWLISPKHIAYFLNYDT